MANSRSVCELLRDLSVIHNKTIVMVTHEPTVAAFAQEVAVLKDGKLVKRFATDEAGGQAVSIDMQRAGLELLQVADPLVGRAPEELRPLTAALWVGTRYSASSGLTSIRRALGQRCGRRFTPCARRSAPSRSYPVGMSA